MLHVKDLIFAYPGQNSPYRFSLDAAPGEITAISGASGAGKSTLFDLLAGFLSPLSGTISLNGQHLIPLPPEIRPLSLLLQSDNLFDHLSVEKNIILGLPPNTSRNSTKQRITQALEEVGLFGLNQRPAYTLSGGQKQRVALARTLLRARPVLLLDEPFSALDDDTRLTTRDLVHTLTRRHGWHTILVSHHADDGEVLAKRRYTLLDQKLTESATLPEETDPPCSLRPQRDRNL